MSSTNPFMTSSSLLLLWPVPKTPLTSQRKQRAFAILFVNFVSGQFLASPVPLRQQLTVLAMNLDGI
jgi:hypothetical protein